MRRLREDYIKTLCNAWRKLEILAPHEYYILNRCSISGTIRMGGLSPGLTRFTEKQTASLHEYWGVLDPACVGFGWLTFDESSYLHDADPDCFYLIDPPYYGNTGLYNHGTIDHGELKAEIEKIPSKWMMTINYCPEIRELYSGCNIRPLEITYGMNNCSKEGTQKRAAELLITNY